MLVRATLTLRNEKMLAAREKLGLNQHALASISGVSLRIVLSAERMDFSHISEQKIVRLAGALDLRPEDIVPPELMGKVLPTKFVSIKEIPSERILSSGSPAVGVLDMKRSVAEWEKTIRAICSYRESIIVFGRMTGKTVDELSEQFKVTLGRVRQLCMRGVSKIELRAFGQTEELRNEAREIYSVLEALKINSGKYEVRSKSLQGYQEYMEEKRSRIG